MARNNGNSRVSSRPPLHHLHLPLGALGTGWGWGQWDQWSIKEIWYRRIEDRPFFACKYCQKRFTGMPNLKKHIITHTGERPYVCTHCGKSFGLKWTLNLHLRTHSIKRPYACEQCTRAFSNNKDLKRHLVIHSGERPFKCWICGCISSAAFRQKYNLYLHIKNVHNQPEEIAKRLENEAAAEYLATNQFPLPRSSQQ